MNDIATTEERIKAAITEEAQGYNVPEFIRGQADCRAGRPHRVGQGESYDAGYSAEYQLEQILENQ